MRKELSGEKQIETPQTPQASSIVPVYRQKAIAKYLSLYCECGWMFTAWNTHIECINPACPIYQKKFKVPTFELEDL